MFIAARLVRNRYISSMEEGRERGGEILIEGVRAATGEG